jgi:integrase
MNNTNHAKSKCSIKRKLSDKFLDQQKPALPGQRIVIWDTTPGFGCRITDKGRISFFAMRRRAGERKGKPIRIVLGPYGPQWNVQTARAKAKVYLDELATGNDPRERERKQRQAEERVRTSTFRAVADLYQIRHLQYLDRGLDQWRYIDYELLWPENKRDSWRDKPITKITTDHVLDRMEAVRNRGHKESARALFETIRALFTWARKQRRYNLLELPTNDIDPVAILGKKTKRKTILSDEYLRALWRGAEAFGYPAGHFVKLLLLTAVRRTEAAGARWEEFSFAGKGERAWIIPAHRMKMDAPHVVPITTDIAALLNDVPRLQTGQYVFLNRVGRSHIKGFASIKDKLDMLMLKELRTFAKARGEDPVDVDLIPWRLHDIRRTVRTHLSAINIPEGDTVRELILAHRRPDLHEIYDQYAYFQEKKFALEAWARRLKSIVEARLPGENVIALSAA